MGIADCLNDEAFSIHEAATADEAVAIPNYNPDVRNVVTEVDMLGSVDGLALAAAVGGRWSPIKIIVTSGHGAVKAEHLPAQGCPQPFPKDKAKHVF